MRREALKGHLDLLLLAVVAPGPTHGYAVIEELRRASGYVFDLPEGTIYPALHRLERAGFLASEWSTNEGRRRRVYSLTDRGREALDAQRQEWQAFAGAMQLVLRGAT
ncbi:MAG: helix-turn-helix transcriptional regulator [Actinomycetota bacterium]|nr:helix-turn-helix transcriptional regulator [Actinomycetota bacterium]